MRSMTVFNFLLEATVIGSVIILLVIAVRALLRDRLPCTACPSGSSSPCGCWWRCACCCPFRCPIL